jgi:hypothetical protein
MLYDGDSKYVFITCTGMKSSLWTYWDDDGNDGDGYNFITGT